MKDPKFEWVRMDHASLQFSDRPRYVWHDLNKIFGRGSEMITGTEANNDFIKRALMRAAERHGYRLNIGGTTWVAVKKSFIKGQWAQGFIPVLPAGVGLTPHQTRGIAWATFETHNLGTISVGAGHYLIRGRPKGARNYMRVNTEHNQEFANSIYKWMREAARGSALAFYGGDQNIDDKTHDTFFKHPVTSSWDELGKWPKTGGSDTIDVIASLDSDHRVVAKQANVLNDDDFFLHMDHFLITTLFRIKTIRR